MRLKLCSVHIPKTAGSTILRVHSEVWGYKNVLVDNSADWHLPSVLWSGSELSESANSPTSEFKTFVRFLKKNYISHSYYLSKFYAYLNRFILNQMSLQSIPQDLIVVHGHFDFHKYTTYCDDSTIMATMLRDPLERAISHYGFLKEYNAFFPVPGWYRNDMGFMEFLSTPQLVNFQSKFLCQRSDIDIESIPQVFQVLGTMTDIEGYFCQLAERVNYGYSQFVAENRIPCILKSTQEPYQPSDTEVEAPFMH